MSLRVVALELVLGLIRLRVPPGQRIVVEIVGDYEM